MGVGVGSVVGWGGVMTHADTHLGVVIVGVVLGVGDHGEQRGASQYEQRDGSGRGDDAELGVGGEQGARRIGPHAARAPGQRCQRQRLERLARQGPRRLAAQPPQHRLRGGARHAAEQRRQVAAVTRPGIAAQQHLQGDKSYTMKGRSSRFC